MSCSYLSSTQAVCGCDGTCEDFCLPICHRQEVTVCCKSRTPTLLRYAFVARALLPFPKSDMLFRLLSRSLALVDVLAKYSRSDSGSSRGAEGPSTTGHDLLAGAALPDADGLALDRVLAAEGASVLGVLRDFDLLDLTTQRGTVTGTVLSGDSNLDSALRLFVFIDAMR